MAGSFADFADVKYFSNNSYCRAVGYMDERQRRSLGGRSLVLVKVEAQTATAQSSQLLWRLSAGIHQSRANGMPRLEILIVMVT